MLESLIPTFEVGQRVRIHNRPMEYECPGCGKRMFHKNHKAEYFGVVVALNVPYGCPRCHNFERNEGRWHSVKLDDKRLWAVPCTLIEPIEEEEE